MENKIAEMLQKVARGNKRATITAVFFAVVIFAWFVATLLVGKMAADSQLGQLEAFFVLIGQKEVGISISNSLMPAAWLSGLFWAVLVLWILPGITICYRQRWWPFEGLRR